MGDVSRADGIPRRARGRWYQRARAFFAGDDAENKMKTGSSGLQLTSQQGCRRGAARGLVTRSVASRHLNPPLRILRAP